MNRSDAGEDRRRQIGEIAAEVAARLSFYREMGIDVWKADRSPNPPPLPPPPANFIPVETVISKQVTEVVKPTLSMVREEIGDCRRCKLCEGRTNIAFGTGAPDAELMFVGEAPGEDEDRQGIPFVGRAGQLLTKMIVAMGLSRESVYIANIVKCRPPSNRNPEPDEIAACRPFLQQQIEAVRPKVVCALGTFSAQTLLSTREPISALRGRFHPLGDLKVMPTYHPAYLLRSPSEKKKVWEDLQQIMAALHLPPPPA